MSKTLKMTLVGCYLCEDNAAGICLACHTTTKAQNARLRAALREVVADWHSNSRNFEREIGKGTPKWLDRARKILAEVPS